MAHQTPTYPACTFPDELTDGIMVDLPFRRLFMGAKAKERESNTANDVMDSITLPSTALGLRAQMPPEDMELITKELYRTLDGLSFMDILPKGTLEEKEDIAAARQGNVGEITPEVRFREALYLSARVIRYWGKQQTPTDAKPEDEVKAMRKAAELIADLVYGIDGDALEEQDSISKFAIYDIKLWLQSGGLDKDSTFEDSYKQLGPNDHRGVRPGDAWPADYPKKQPHEYQCSVCSETFALSAELEQHLRDHETARRREKGKNKRRRAGRQRIAGRQRGESDQMEPDGSRERAGPRGEVSKRKEAGQREELSATKRIHQQSISQMRVRTPTKPSEPSLDETRFTRPPPPIVSVGRTTRQIVMGDPAPQRASRRQMGENQGYGPKEDPQAVDKTTTGKAASPIDEDWCEIPLAPSSPLQPRLSCTYCFKTYATASTLRNHYNAKHKDSEEP